MYAVLVVEDEINVQKGIVYIIERHLPGWHVYAVGDGQSALNILAKETIHVVLTDIRIPGMDGLELLEVINSQYPTIITAVLSGYADFRYAQSALRSGAIDYLLKPTSPKAMVNLFLKIENLLEERKALFYVSTGQTRTDLHELEKVIYPLLVQNNKEELKKILTEWLELSVNINRFSHGTLREINDKLIVLIIDLCGELDREHKKFQEEQKLFEQQGYILNIRTEEDWNRWKEEFLRLWEVETLLETKKLTPVIRQSVQYIGENYFENLSLKTLSEKLYINETYLSFLFKREMGINFLEYLTQIRMEHAEVLLKEEKNYKIYEIAHLIGYQSERYFATLFKRYSGLTPGEYRAAQQKSK